MATTRTVTVKSSGGDYTDLATALSTESKNLVSLDRVLVIELYASAGAQAKFALSGWTMDATRYLKIVAPAGQRHAGLWTTGKSRIVDTSGGYGTAIATVNASDFVVFEGMQFEQQQGNNNEGKGIVVDDVGSGGILTLKDCIIRQAVGATTPAYSNGGIHLFATGAHEVRVQRTLVNGFAWGIWARFSTAARTILLYNPTLVDGINGGIDFSGLYGATVARIKNALIQGSGTNFLDTVSGITKDYVTILTQDTTSPTVGLRSKTVSFVGGGDYTPASGDTAAKDAGTDLSADSYLPHTTDLAGYTVSGSWDVGALEYQAAATPALLVDTQPSTTASGYIMSPSPIVEMTTDGSTVDTGFTGNITAALIGSGGVLLGTTTVAAVAGVATFSALRPCIAGSYTLRFSASGVDDLDSDSFTVTTAGGGSGTILLGGGMYTTQIRRNDGTAALRRIYFDIRDDVGAAWSGSVTGVKAKLGVNGVGNDDSSADIVRVAGALHYVELAQTDTDIAEGSVITGRVPAASGRLEATGAGQIIPGDSYAAAVSETSLVNKIVRAANGADGYIARKNVAESRIELVIPGVGTVNIPASFDEASVPVDAIGE
jgi:hypothetical protein